MKKLLTLAALLGAASFSYGQGIVSFTSGTVRLSTNSVVGGPATGQISGPTAYYFALLEASSTQNSIDLGLSGWTSVAIGTNSVVGRFSGNYTTDPGVVVQGNPGGSADFAILGWSANIGTDLNAFLQWYNDGNVATTGWFGLSAVADNVVIGGGAIPVPSVMGTSGSSVAPAFLLARLDPVPEPATFALAGLGMAGMLIFRRRKA